MSLYSETISSMAIGSNGTFTAYKHGITCVIRRSNLLGSMSKYSKPKKLKYSKKHIF